MAFIVIIMKRLHHDGCTVLIHCLTTYYRYDLPHEKRKQLSTDLYDLLKGKAKEVYLKYQHMKLY